MDIEWACVNGHENRLFVHRHDGKFSNEATFDLHDGADFACTNITREAAAEVVNALIDQMGLVCSTTGMRPHVEVDPEESR